MLFNQGQTLIKEHVYIKGGQTLIEEHVYIKGGQTLIKEHVYIKGDRPSFFEITSPHLLKKKSIIIKIQTKIILGGTIWMAGRVIPYIF